MQRAAMSTLRYTQLLPRDAHVDSPLSHTTLHSHCTIIQPPTASSTLDTTAVQTARCILEALSPQLAVAFSGCPRCFLFLRCELSRDIVVCSLELIERYLHLISLIQSCKLSCFKFQIQNKLCAP